MIGAAAALVSSFALSLGAVALVLRLARKRSWYDRINERKIHTGDIPRLGGAGFAVAYIAVAFFINFFSAGAYFGFRFLSSLIALILILGTGIADDFRPIVPRYKLGLQVIAALCVILPGYSFQRFFFNDWEAPFRMEIVYQGLLYLLSFFWVVGVTNAINFIDGVDGLAGGISLLAALTYALIFSALGNTGAAVLFCLCLAAVTLGFLVFNLPLPKARIFMGDGGAYFLGFVLAILPLISAEDGLGLPLPYAAILLSIPIFDTFAAMWRRLRDGRRIDSPDMLHTHHKLINLGLSSRGVDLVLYSLQILIGVLVYFSVKRQGLPSLVLLGTAYALVIGFFTALHFMNRAALRKKQAGAGQG